MATFKCKMCGGTLDIKSGSTIAECEYCGTKQTLPKLDDDKRANLYDRANHFRRSNEFDKATAIYEQILIEDGTDAEAYWSLVLCQYGIEYVEDPESHKRVPTVHRAQFTSIYDDDNYKSAIKLADMNQRILYEEEAKAINEIQKGILAISQKEDPFDVFICYKETDKSGRRTPDSVLANDLYYQLKQEGFKVFFARITLEDKLGLEYEPYIFAALNSAKVMIVLGTRPEYFNAVWVKNEWSRFLSLVKKSGGKKILIPAYKDMDPYDLPDEFSHLQAQDMSKLGFMQDLIRGIKKILGRDKKQSEAVVEKVIVKNEERDIAPLLRRIYLFLEDGDFNSAAEYAEKVLDVNPECAEAYFVKLLIEREIRKPENLISTNKPLAGSPNYQKAIRFATPEYRKTIEGYNKTIIERIETARKNEIYDTGLEEMQCRNYDKAIILFNKISAYKDAAKKIEECRALQEAERLEDLYSRATEALKAKQFDEAKKIFESIIEYKDSNEKIGQCIEKKQIALKDAIYNKALQRVSSPNVDDKAIKRSIEELKTIIGYKNVDDKIRQLNARLEKWYEDQRIAEEEARVKAEEDRRTREREAILQKIEKEQRRKKRIKISIISLSIIAVLATITILCFTLFIPLMKYKKADKLLNEGRFDEAYTIYNDIGNFAKSEQRITVIKGIYEIQQWNYEEGITTVLAAGVPVKIIYEMDGGEFSDSTFITVPSEKKENFVLLNATSGANVVPLETTVNVPDKAEFTYNSVEDFPGLLIPGRNGFKFEEWVFETYDFQSNGNLEVQFIAMWSTKDYIVEYILDGGVVEGGLVVGYDYEDDDFTLINPTRTGYTFAGWIGTGLSAPTVNVTVPTGSFGNRVYTATWQANEYTITYDASGGTVSSETQKVIYDSDFEFLTPERLGYSFKGWFEKNTKYTNGKWTYARDVSLEARWEVIKYDLTYELSGGSSDNPSFYRVTSNTITLKDPVRSGYTFIGWTSDEITTPTKDVRIEKGSAGDRTFTANWQVNTYGITLNANGGTCAETSLIVTFDQKFTLPDPEWEGHTFSGWYAEHTKVASGIYNYSEDLSLQAEWDMIQYTISYTMNGGDNNESNPNSYNYHDTITLKDPIRTGYTFLGWTSNENTTPEKEVIIEFGSTGNLVYTANWIANNYTVTFNANGGTCAEVSRIVTYDQDLVLPEAEWVGHIFSGWYYEKNTIENGVCKFLDDVTLTAEWVNIQYSISYTMNEGTNSASNPDKYNYHDNIVLSNPIRTGYTFIGWTYNGHLTPETEVTIELGSTGDLAYTANWIANTYTVILNANGGVCLKSSIEIMYGDDYTLPMPTKTGYTFNGWFSGTRQYSAGTWSIPDNVTLIARWIARDDINYTVNHYLQNANDNEYTNATTLYLKGTADSVVTPKVNTYEHFVSPKAQSVSINPDETLVVNYYYDRVSYVLTYVTNGGETIGNQSYKYEQTLVIETPSRTNYTFGGWFTNVALEHVYSPTATLNEDTTIYAYWEEENKPADFSYTVNPNGIIINSYIGTSSTMHIPSYIGGTSINYIKESAFENNDTIVKAITPANVSALPNKVFNQCVNLEEVVISQKTITIGKYAFNGCGCITKINSDNNGEIIIPEQVTSIGIQAFRMLEQVSKVVVPESVITIGSSVFDGCNSIEELTLPFCGKDANTERLSYLFNGKYPIGLTDVVITLQTAIPINAFRGLSTVERITIPTDVTSIGSYAFYGCSSLKKLNSDHNGEFVLPNSLTQISEYCFYGCAELQYIEIPDGITTIASNAFNSCIQLETCVINDNSNIETIQSYAFYECLSLARINLPRNLKQIYDNAFGGCVSLAKIGSDIDGELIIPNKVESIGSYAFKNVELITKIVVSDSVAIIDEGVFQGCSSITEIILPFIGRSENAKYYNAVFGYIFGHTKINGATYTSWVYFYDNPSDPSDEFYNNTYGSVNNAVAQYTCGNYYDRVNNTCYYRYCTYWYYIPKIKKITVTKQSAIPIAAFNNCDFVETIVLPIDVNSIGSYAFQNCNAQIDQSYISTTTGKWSGDIASSFFAGDGSEDNPYQIYKASELAYLSSSVNAGEDYSGKYFKLTANIDLGNRSWMPIGTKSAPFAGSFDGNGNTINNISVSGSYEHGGVFGYVTGNISNLGLNNGKVSLSTFNGMAYVGGLCGYTSGTIQNCYSNIQVTIVNNSTTYGGGLIGTTDSTASVINSYSSSQVTITSNNGFAYAGGFIASNKGTIQGCVAYGDVAAKGSSDNYCRNGGLVANNTGSIQDCYRDVDQILTKNTTVNSWYNSDGIAVEKTDILLYCENNWNENWIYDYEFPELIIIVTQQNS